MIISMMIILITIIIVRVRLTWELVVKILLILISYDIVSKIKNISAYIRIIIM